MDYEGNDDQRNIELEVQLLNDSHMDKEGLMTELRVSGDEHRELLCTVNSEDSAPRIRDMGRGVGLQNVAYQASSSTFSAHRTNYQVKLVEGNIFSTPSSSFRPQSGAVGMQSLITPTLNIGPPGGICSQRTNSVQPAFTKSISLDDIMDVSSESNDDESNADLIGRRVMRRWSRDNFFYEAVITQYNPANGQHCFVYCSNTPTPTIEWVDIKKVSQEDLKWLDYDPNLDEAAREIRKGQKQNLDEPSPSSMRGRLRSRLQKGRGRPPLKKKFLDEIQDSPKQDSEKNEACQLGESSVRFIRGRPRNIIRDVMEIRMRQHPDYVEINSPTQQGESSAKRGRRRPPSRNQLAAKIGVVLRQDSDSMEIFHTESLINKVQQVINEDEPDPLQVELASKVLKVQEHALVEAISRLEHSSNEDEDEDEEQSQDEHGGAPGS